MELSLAIEDTVQRLIESVADVFQIQDITTGLAYHKQGVRLRGRLRIPANRAYDLIAPRFAALGYTAFFRREGELHVILAEPGVFKPRRLSPWINLFLFLLTVLSVFYTGLTYIAPPEGRSLADLLPGVGFAVSLLTILVAHEMGHYFVARYFGVPISLPYFIPFPVTLFGTMGAAELMMGRPRDRRALLAVGAAGPLAGLALAVPILILGLLLSEVQRIPSEPVLVEGNSLLYLILKFLIFGRILPSGGYDVFIHPIAFAGWGGLLVTALNLIPAGQLDGGHIIYALFGKRINWLIWPILVILVVLGIYWSAWYVWAFLLYVLGRAHAEPLDDITELTPAGRALAIFMLVIFVLVFSPVPLKIG